VSSFRFIFLRVMAPDAPRDNGSAFPLDQARDEQNEQAFCRIEFIHAQHPETCGHVRFFWEGCVWCGIFIG
jgi:hypothetical protein